MIDMMNPIYLAPCDEAAAAVWTQAKRMLTPYVDLMIQPVPAAGFADEAMILPGKVEGIVEALEALNGALMRRAEVDEQDDLAEFAEVLMQAVQVAQDEIENDDEFLPSVAVCLNQVYGGDLVTVMGDDDQETRYEILYRTEIDGEDYGVLYPIDGESDGSILILKLIYDDDLSEICFEDADEATAAVVFAEFREVFADEFSQDE